MSKDTNQKLGKIKARIGEIQGQLNSANSNTAGQDTSTQAVVSNAKLHLMRQQANRQRLSLETFKSSLQSKPRATFESLTSENFVKAFQWMGRESVSLLFKKNRTGFLSHLEMRTQALEQNRGFASHQVTSLATVTVALRAKESLQGQLTQLTAQRDTLQAQIERDEKIQIQAGEYEEQGLSETAAQFLGAVMVDHPSLNAALVVELLQKLTPADQDRLIASIPANPAEVTVTKVQSRLTRQRYDDLFLAHQFDAETQNKFNELLPETQQELCTDFSNDDVIDGALAFRVNAEYSLLPMNKVLSLYRLPVDLNNQMQALFAQLKLDMNNDPKASERVELIGQAALKLVNTLATGTVEEKVAALEEFNKQTSDPTLWEKYGSFIKGIAANATIIVVGALTGGLVVGAVVAAVTLPAAYCYGDTTLNIFKGRTFNGADSGINQIWEALRNKTSDNNSGISLLENPIEIPSPA